jgi:hypothetical protein
MSVPRGSFQVINLLPDGLTCFLREPSSTAHLAESLIVEQIFHDEKIDLHRL